MHFIRGFNSSPERKIIDLYIGPYISYFEQKRYPVTQILGFYSEKQILLSY